MKPSKPLPPELNAGPFSVARARELGVHSERLRRSDLVAPFHGARMQEGAVDLLTLCTAYRQRMRPNQFFSHATAARILGIPLPRADRPNEHRLHVSVLAPLRAVRANGVIGHQLAPEQTRLGTFHGFPVTSPATTWCLLAASLNRANLVAVGDSVVAGAHQLAELDELKQALARGRWRGSDTLREALTLIRVGSESRPESLLRVILVTHGIVEPQLNLDIRDEFGRFLGRADLVYPEYRVIVEYEGKQHWMSETQFEHDIDRLNSFVEAGWRVVRISKRHLFDVPNEAIRRVQTALEDAGWRT